MKRLIISLVLTAAAIAASALSYHDVVSTGRRMTGLLQNCAAYIESGDIDSAQAEVDLCVEIWEKRRGRIELYLYSQELYDIDRIFNQIQKLPGAENAEEFEKLVNENIDNINRMIENQTPSFRKVF